jgi:hypothetical protein
MKKTCVFLAGILVIFIAFACELPSSLELKSERFEMNAPVKIARFNIATVLSEALKSSFPEGFEIYDMVNYRGAQAFLIGYQMDLMESFNPDDYLEKLANPDGIPPIYPEPIVIPKMTSDTITNTWFYFEMQAFFDSMREEINHDSTPATIIPLGAWHNQTSVTVDMSGAVFPDFMVFKQDNGPKNFDAVFVHTGEIKVDIELQFTGNPNPADLENLEIILHDIEMTGPAYINTTAPSPQKVVLSYDDGHKAAITIDIGDTEIEQANPPRFSIGRIESVLEGYSTPKNFTFTLTLKPRLNGITLRGARALKIGRMAQPVPQEIIDNIQLEPVADMLNAKIEEGYFRITPNLPANTGPSTTYCEGLKIGYEIKVNQTAVVHGGETFDGLNETFARDPFSEENPSLQDKWINGHPLTVNKDDSTIIIEADHATGVTFQLFDDKDAYGNYIYDPLYLPYTKKIMPIKLDMGMTIEKLEVVRWKTISSVTGKSILPPIDLPEINFANMGEQSVSFINWIDFREIKLNVDFTVPDDPPLPPPGRTPLTPGRGLPEALETHIALKVICPELGFEDGDDDHTKPLVDGMNTFTGKEPTPGKWITLKVNDSAAKVKFEVELIPVIDGEPKEGSLVMEFGPVIMNGAEDIKMDMYAQVTVDFDWEQAEIDLQKAMDLTEPELKGTFPKDADGVDLSEMGRYMKDVTFSDNLRAKIFLSGPEAIVKEFRPRLDFHAQWGDDNSPDGMEMMHDKELAAGGKLPELPGKHSRDGWVYRGTELPKKDEGLDVDHFNDIITEFPQNLHFNYEMKLGNPTPVIVKHGEFRDEDDNKIRASLLLLLPLEFVVEENGSFMIPGDIFGGEEGEDGEIIPVDLFGRTTAGEDSLFTGVNIKSLGININFGSAMFAGSNLHFDKKDLLFGDKGYHLGNSGNLNIILTGEKLKIIEANLISPDIRFVFPRKKTVRIGRSFLPLRIVIAASGSYTLNLDDLLGSGN